MQLGSGKGRGDDGLRWFERGLSGSPLVVLIPVVVLVVSALGAFVYGADVFAGSVGHVVAHPLPVGKRIGLFLQIIDLFLIGATMLIAAFGFYELFIGRTSGRLRTPHWLAMHDLNDLKARVVAMVVLMSAVTFVEALVDVPSGIEVLELGGGVSAVIVALTLFVRFGDRRGPNQSPERPANGHADRRASREPETGSLVERVGGGVGDVEEDG